MSNQYTFILEQCYHGNEPKFPWYEEKALNMVLKLRREFCIDNKGNITLRGTVKMLMDVFGLNYLEVLALAFVASRPSTADRSTFEYTALAFKLKRIRIENVFNKLCTKKLIRSLGHGVYELSNTSIRLLKQYMPSLRDIDLQCDSLLQDKWIKNHESNKN